MGRRLEHLGLSNLEKDDKREVIEVYKIKHGMEKVDREKLFLPLP